MIRQDHCIKEFFSYIFGRKFLLLTDYQALALILHPQASLPVLSATCLLHYAFFLQGVDYDIKFRKTQLHGNTIFCCRFNYDDPTILSNELQLFLQCNQIRTIPVPKAKLAAETARNQSMASLLPKLLRTATPMNSKIFEEFTTESGCILRGSACLSRQNFITMCSENSILGFLCSLRYVEALARNYEHWLELDKDIKDLVKNWILCAKNEAAQHNARWCICGSTALALGKGYTSVLLILQSVSFWLLLTRIPSGLRPSLSAQFQLLLISSIFAKSLPVSVCRFYLSLWQRTSFRLPRLCRFPKSEWDQIFDFHALFPAIKRTGGTLCKYHQTTLTCACCWSRIFINAH